MAAPTHRQWDQTQLGWQRALELVVVQDDLQLDACTHKLGALGLCKQQAGQARSRPRTIRAHKISVGERGGHGARQSIEGDVKVDQAAAGHPVGRQAA